MRLIGGLRKLDPKVSAVLGLILIIWFPLALTVLGAALVLESAVENWLRPAYDRWRRTDAGRNEKSY